MLISSIVVNVSHADDAVFRLFPDDLRKEAFETLHEKTHNDFIPTASAPIAVTYLGLTDLVTDPAYHSTLNPEKAADTALAFRDALSHGIKTGKQEHKHASPPPETVLIDANTQLYEYPQITASDLSQDLYRKYGKGMRDRDGTKLTEKHEFPPKLAISHLKADISLWTSWKLYQRRTNATTTPTHHDTKPDAPPWF